MGAENPRGNLRARGVGQRPRQRVFARGRHLVEQGCRPRKGTKLRQALGRKLGNEKIDVEADARGPAHRRRGEPARAQGSRQGRNCDVAGVPIPGAVRTVLRIEDPIVVDAVNGRRHAGDERRMGRKGERGQHADDAACKHALSREPLQGGHLREAPFRVRFRLHPVDRDDDHVRGGPVRAGGHGQPQCRDRDGTDDGSEDRPRASRQVLAHDAI